MKKQKKKVVICFSAAHETASSESHTWAMELSFTPSAASVNDEEAIDLYVILSGLENGAKMNSFKNISAFDFKIKYDPAVFSFDAYMPESGLNDTDIDRNCRNFGNWGNRIPAFSHQSSLSNSGKSHQPDFTLATISFMGSGFQENDMSALNITLNEDSENCLSATMGSPYTETSENSESAVRMFLLKRGLIGLARLKSKLKGKYENSALLGEGESLPLFQSVSDGVKRV